MLPNLPGRDGTGLEKGEGAMPGENDPNNSGTGGDAGGDPNALGDAGKRALAAERKRATEAERRAAELEAELQKARDKDKPDIERLTGERDAAAKRASDAETAMLKLSIGLDKGLTPAQARRLTGSTREELEADADELATAFGIGGGGNGGGNGAGNSSSDSGDGKTPAGRPREQMPRGGADPTEEPEETDPAKLADLIPRR